LSLHPITKSRHSRKTRGAYRSFRSRQQWKPWQGWNYHVSRNPLEWFSHKRFVLGIVMVASIVGGTVLAQGPLFHSHLPFIGNSFIDPVTTIWKVTAPDNNLGEFNTVNVGFTTPFGQGPHFQMEANGTQAAVALTKSPIGDLGIIAAKQMFYRAQYLVVGTCCGTGLSHSFGFYLTTNKTLPTQLGYDPLDDKSIGMLVTIFESSPGVFANDLFMQRNIGDTIRSENFGCSASGSCYVGTTDTIDPTVNSVTIGAVLNFTTQGNLAGGCVGTTGGPGCSELAIGPGTTVPPTVNEWNQQIPWFKFQGEQYYAGFYSLAANDAFNPSFNYEATVSGTFEPNDVAYYVPGPDCPGQANGPCNPDAGGFFGPVITALVSIGIFIFNSILAFVAFIAPALQTAITFLETLVQNVLNLIGNALGFGNVGTQLFTFLNQVVTFFTSFLPTGLTNFPTFMSRFFDYLNIVFPILPSAFATSLAVLTFGVNVISEGVTIFIFGLQFIIAAYAFFLIFSFMIFTADDALGGVVEYLGTAEALAFFLIKWAALLTNLGLDIGTWIIGLIPKPFIQMAAARLPRIPILESSARIVLPSFDFGELRSGNLLSPWLWTLGFWFDTWYESRNPALPGSLCNLVPATCTNMQLLSNLLPLMQVFVFMSSGVLALWIVMRPLELLGADLGIFESIGVGLGRKPVSGPGGISIARAGKHFQSRLQKAVEKQKGTQGFKPLGPFSPGAKLEKGVGTKEAVSTARLFE
jgi:hypothetical protein